MGEERKSFQAAASFKADGTAGEFSAVFSSFDVIDSDGDVTRAGAFAEGSDVIVGSWGHKTGELPTGKATIHSNRDEAVIDGGFNLNTPAGKDTYETVKFNGDLQEWSYVFRVTKQSFGEFEGRDVRFIEEARVYSVDPVLAGAGVNTRTVDIKSLNDQTFIEHGDQVAELLGEYADRAKERAAIREKDGRALSAANVERLTGLAESLKATSDELEQLLLAGSESKQEDEVDLGAQYLRYQLLRARSQGVA